MKQAYLNVRSAILWAISGIHFAVVGTILIALGAVVDPRKNDWPQRLFFRNILRLAGARFEVRRAPGFDPARTSIFICNHVNLFDPVRDLLRHPAIPARFRARITFQSSRVRLDDGPLRKYSCARQPSREGLEIMTQRAKTALDSGVSLLAFAEGSRTRTGHVQPFKKGIFNLAQKFGVPIVPVSMVGSYQFFQTGHWMLHPEKITVHIHDTIDTTQIARADVDALRQRVQEIVSEPVEKSLQENPVRKY